MPRQPNGRPAIYQAADGGYHTFVSTSKGRRHVRGKTATEVADKVTELQGKLRIGHVPDAGKSPTLGSWLEHYLTVIAPRNVRGSTLQGYESKMRHNVIPALGHLKLSTPVAELAEKVETWFGRFEKRVAPATALQTFRILDKALSIAVMRGRLPRNPCDLMEPPSGGSDEVKPLTAPELRRILVAAKAHDALARWWVALALGLRQGETLGLMWDHVDLDSEVPALTVRWELIRLKWRHGCDENPCGKKRGADCPERHGGGLVFEPPKSKKGRRTIPIPALIADVLRMHRKLQRELSMRNRGDWRKVAGPDGENGGLVFPNRFGAPCSPEDDWEQWKAILVAAQVRTVTRTAQRGRKAGQSYETSTVKVHDARHAAGTVLRGTGAERQELMEWLGHAQIGVSARYTHTPENLMQERAERLNDAWKAIAADEGTVTDLGQARQRRRQAQ